ncbi:phage Gp37/Gp68 family protein [Mesorhizobium sp. M0174]|uniref:DUF5131 family protein n=1 Tax=Mesorhizobium sp. M0174 TaxID=2956904 RepID=UPI0033382E26
MADKSAIEWTDATWNPIVGCSIDTTGCIHCYAMKMAGRIEAMTAALRAKGQTGAPHYDGTTKVVNGKTVWTGKLAMAPDHILTEPLTWRTPRRIFVNSMGDLFHEDVPDEWIDKVFAIMALAPQHTFQVLTKRAKRMREYLAASRASPVALEAMEITLFDHFANPASEVGKGCIIAGDIPHLKVWPLPNVWLGVSAERQQEADERIPELLATPAAIRFVSAEPLLGPIDFTRMRPAPERQIYGFPNLDALRGAWFVDGHRPDDEIPDTAVRIDWIIVGGESGPGARPMHPAWARSIRDQCQAAGVPFFFKQWGAWAPGNWAFDLDDHLHFFPDDERVPVIGLSDHQRAQARMIWSEDDKTPEGRGFLNVGKKAAGRLLDGIEHNAMPEVTA